MKLSSNMLFAHPVLSAASTDYSDATFEVTFALESNADVLNITSNGTMTCPELHSLLDDGSAGFGFYLICPRTYHNRLVETTMAERTHRFTLSDYFGTVVIQPVLWSKELCTGWHSPRLHAEYGGAVSLPSAAVLAIGERRRFSVDRQRLRPIESIFSLAARDELPHGQFSVDVEDDKIAIHAHSKTKEVVEEFRNNPRGRQVLLNSVYFPAVMHVLSEVSKDSTRLGDRTWFRIFEAKCSAIGIDLDRPEPLADAQRLLNLPFLKLVAEKDRLGD